MKRLATKTKKALRTVRHARVRKVLCGTAEKPRLSVFRGLKAMTVQLVDDVHGTTLCYAKSTAVKPVKVEGKSAKVATAFLLGKMLAEKATAKGITTAVFDRGGYQYHGRVAAVAEGARAGGLHF